VDNAVHGRARSKSAEAAVALAPTLRVRLLELDHLALDHESKVRVVVGLVHSELIMSRIRTFAGARVDGTNLLSTMWCPTSAWRISSSGSVPKVVGYEAVAEFGHGCEGSREGGRMD